jgi:hypothetical protein
MVSFPGRPDGDLRVQKEGSGHSANSLPNDFSARLDRAESGCSVTREETHGSTLTSSSATTVKVRNTFIDGFQDEGSDEELEPMIASKSCPVAPVAVYTPAGDYAALLGSVNEVDEHDHVHYVPAPHHIVGEATLVDPKHAMARADPPMPVLPRGQVELPEGTTGADATPSRVGASPSQRPPALPGILPLEVRQPEWSLGSDLHGSGECRPCAWFWRPQGCTNGSECRHCHLCPAGEVKARRKSKLATLRQNGNTEHRESVDSIRSYKADEIRTAAAGVVVS